MLTGKNILLGITGSIAAYKSIELSQRLKDEGAHIRVVTTEAAQRFITPLVLETVTGSPVLTDLFTDPLSHIRMAEDSHLLLIAPATANTINKLACGIADNLLTSIWLAYKGPALIAPAMNSRMYNSSIVTESIKKLSNLGVHFVGPVYGKLACGEEGVGRMAEVPDIVEAAISLLSPKDLTGHSILVTAGPTREAIDPVRFISNRSSGRMGYAIARAALRRGARVILISGPSHLEPVSGATFIQVESAAEMEAAVMDNLSGATSVIMAAAVCDFAPAKSSSKIRKTEVSSITLNRTPDILKKIGRQKGKGILIGFAAETGKDLSSARKKLKEKNLDMIVLNDVTREGAGFDVETNIVSIIDRKGRCTDYPLMKKTELANIILDRLLELSGRKETP